jgi:hypothetical protein
MNAQCSTREVYTVSVDTRYVKSPVSNNAFTAYINVPLRNVVKAELIAASIHPAANTSAVVYLHVAELVSKFNDHASLLFQQNVSGISSNVSSLSQLVSNVNFINQSLLMYPINGSDLDTPNVPRIIYRSNADFPVEVNFIEPIRRLDKLTVSMYTDVGGAFLTSAPTFLTFRFECAKDNVCLY